VAKIGVGGGFAVLAFLGVFVGEAQGKVKHIIFYIKFTFFKQCKDRCIW